MSTGMLENGLEVRVYNVPCFCVVLSVAEPSLEGGAFASRIGLESAT